MVIAAATKTFLMPEPMNQHVPLTRPAEPAATPAPPGKVVRLVGLKRRFGETAALDGVSLDLRRGEILGLIGRSGAGKSTLIRCLNGLERPDEGQVFVEGREISDLSEGELQPLRRSVGMIFQHFNLLSAKTVAANVALPLKIAGVARAERAARAAELLQLVGLAEKARDYPASLSGGQKQRVGIARALAANPALLLSDEATSALDPETTRAILQLLKDINRRLGLTILLITHEMEVVRAIADRVAVIDEGRIVEEGPVWQVFAEPRSEVTRSLLASVRPRLPEALAARLLPVPAADGRGEAVLRLRAAGRPARGPLLAGLAQHGPFRLLHGQVEELGGEPVANLLLAIPQDPPEALARCLRFLASQGAHAEVIGHVAGDD